MVLAIELTVLTTPKYILPSSYTPRRTSSANGRMLPAILVTISSTCVCVSSTYTSLRPRVHLLLELLGLTFARELLGQPPHLLLLHGTCRLHIHMQIHSVSRLQM